MIKYKEISVNFKAYMVDIGEEIMNWVEENNIKKYKVLGYHVCGQASHLEKYALIEYEEAESNNDKDHVSE